MAALGLAAGCSSHRFEYVRVRSHAEGRTLRYGVELPIGWDGKTALPVVVLLHGAGDHADSADRREVTQRLDAATAAGDLPPFLLVTPEGDLGFWVNWYDGSHHWRDWVMDEVIPAVQQSYPTVDGPAGLHLVGVSMGGGGGLQMWLHDPGRFGSATILSAPILSEAKTRAFLAHFLPHRILQRVFGPPGSGSGIDPYVALSGPGALHGSKLLFGAASHDRDGILASNVAFDEHLDRKKVPHRFVEFEGSHGWRAWAKVLPLALCLQLEPDCALAPR